MIYEIDGIKISNGENSKEIIISLGIILVEEVIESLN